MYAYYSKYPPTQAFGQVSTYCQINQYAGKNLVQNLKKQYAPVVCGQNPPESVSVSGTPEINGSTATVILTQYYGSITSQVTYQLQQETGVWKIENILCPAP